MSRRPNGLRDASRAAMHVPVRAAVPVSVRAAMTAAGAILAVVCLAACGMSLGAGASSAPPPAAPAAIPHQAPSPQPRPTMAKPGPSSGIDAPPLTAHAGGDSSPTQAKIDALDARIAANPNDGDALRDLGALLLQRVRETGDPGLYGRADEAFRRARSLLPDDPLVLVGIGTLQLARHQFADALGTGRQALALEPVLPEAEGVVVDALVELGRYDKAVAAAQRMIDERPDLSSYARVSYLRELHGDLPGALDAMEAAISAGGGATENTAYVTVLAGNLLTLLGRRSDASAAYRRALEVFPGFAPAIAAEGRAAVAAGDLPAAIARFTAASAILPLPEYVIALGEAEEASGDMAAAHRSWDLARAETQLFKANGVVVDLELALFEADHGDPKVSLALAREAYDERPTVKAADALAWAFHRMGDEPSALKHSIEALRLGSKDPVLLYHAGMIEAAAGKTTEARGHLRAALTLDAGFSATGATLARAELARLGG